MPEGNRGRCSPNHFFDFSRNRFFRVSSRINQRTPESFRRKAPGDESLKCFCPHEEAQGAVLPFSGFNAAGKDEDRGFLSLCGDVEGVSPFKGSEDQLCEGRKG